MVFVQQTHKLCPRCATQAVVDAQTCQHCGHIYRTQFAKPTPDQTIAFTPGSQQTTQMPPQATAPMPPPGQGFHQQAPSQPFQQQPAALPPQGYMAPMIGGLQFNPTDRFESNVMAAIRWLIFATFLGGAAGSLVYSSVYPWLWASFLVSLFLAGWALLHLRRMYMAPRIRWPFFVGLAASLALTAGSGYLTSINARDVRAEVAKQRLATFADAFEVEQAYEQHEGQSYNPATPDYRATADVRTDPEYQTYKRNRLEQMRVEKQNEDTEAVQKARDYWGDDSSWQR